MSKSFLKIGQLVYGSNSMSYTKSNGGYGIITDMIDINGKSHNELNVITGCGDENTNVKIVVKILTKPCGDIWRMTSKIVLLDKPTIDSFDPHDISKISYDKFIKIYEETISDMNYKLDFIKKYHLTRDDKLNIILE